MKHAQTCELYFLLLYMLKAQFLTHSNKNHS